MNKNKKVYNVAKCGACSIMYPFYSRKTNLFSSNSEQNS